MKTNAGALLPYRSGAPKRNQREPTQEDAAKGSVSPAGSVRVRFWKPTGLPFIAEPVRFANRTGQRQKSQHKGGIDADGGRRHSRGAFAAAARKKHPSDASFPYDNSGAAEHTMIAVDTTVKSIRCKEMNRMSSSKIVVPQAREALDRFKMEAANEVGVSLKDGYNGELTSKQAGSIGGQMVKKMIESYESNLK